MHRLARFSLELERAAGLAGLLADNDPADERAVAVEPSSQPIERRAGRLALTGRTGTGSQGLELFCLVGVSLREREAGEVYRRGGDDHATTSSVLSFSAANT